MTHEKVDPKRCVERVHEGGRWPRFHQCTRKRTHGDYCKQHSAEDRAKRAADREARWQKRSAVFDLIARERDVGARVIALVEGGHGLSAHFFMAEVERIVRESK